MERFPKRMRDVHPTKIIETAAKNIPEPSQDAIDKAMRLCDEENINSLHNLYFQRLAYGPSQARKTSVGGIFVGCSSTYTGEAGNRWRSSKSSPYSTTIEKSQPRRTAHNVCNIIKKLMCFSKIADLKEPPMIYEEHILTHFDGSIHWLAVIICRACPHISDVNEVMGLNDHPQRLGHPVPGAVQELQEKRASDIQKAMSKMASHASSKGRKTAKTSGSEP